ncbi:SagB/ThcOx family dehydrogenase [Haloarcula sp. JP-L23]|nr:SagB/ThcOx family dehydrogenase [Haloarcula sp. JP-L23]
MSAIDYHERTKHTPRSVRSGSGLDFDNKPRPYKSYNGVPTVSLADAIRDPAMPALHAVATQPPPDTDASTSFDRATLAGLCYYAAGITKSIRRHGQNYHFRAAACTGALYHIDLYLVCGDLDDLDDGVYHYDPRTESLDMLRDGDYRGVLVKASRDPAVTRAPVTFVVTSTWWRNAWKYGARTYRHAFWDSGTVLANLVAAAHALDRPATIVSGFADDPVATLLGIDPEWEAPLELVPVGVGAPVARSSGTSAVEPIDPPTEPLASDPIAYPLIHQAWTGSTLSAGTAAQAWRTRGERPVDGRRPGDGDRVELDPVGPDTASTRPLHTTIRRRGSCRAYERDTLSFRKLSTVLDRATRGVPMDVRADDGDSGTGAALQFVDCYCIVNGVADLEPGAYQYHPDAGELERIHAGESRQAARHLALDQQLGADAAVCIYFLADLDAVTDALGNRGYRVAQLEAALTAGRLYLSTYAHRDLGGTGLTFFDDVVTDFFEPRAAGQTPIFLYTLGRPA